MWIVLGSEDNQVILPDILCRDLVYRSSPTPPRCISGTCRQRRSSRSWPVTRTWCCALPATLQRTSSPWPGWRMTRHLRARVACISIHLPASIVTTKSCIVLFWLFPLSGFWLLPAFVSCKFKLKDYWGLFESLDTLA